MTGISTLTGQITLLSVAALIPVLLLWHAVNPARRPAFDGFRTALRATTDIVGQLSVLTAFVLILVWCAEATISAVGFGGFVWHTLLASAASAVFVIPLALRRRRRWQRTSSGPRPDR